MFWRASYGAVVSLTRTVFDESSNISKSALDADDSVTKTSTSRLECTS